MTRAMTPLLALVGILSFWGTAQAHDPDETDLEVPEIAVIGEKPVAASSQQFIPDKEIVLQPQGRPAQVLRLIPGFVAVEHSGGAGKADQYFLRGFDADHGTDVGFFLNGMPINLRTHAHGQGYTDLNFIIPETIEGVDVHKGAYLPEYGDFVTAGAVNFRTRDMVKEGLLQGAGGEYSTQRYLLMLSPTKDRVRTLFAAEGFYTNGPYLNDNNYHRANLFGKVTTNLTGRDELSLQATFLQSRWDGSGEIPFRAVSNGLLDRFGSINPYEGGNTLRTTGQLNYHYDTTTGGQFFANAYGQYYRLDLFTDFTFFLNDPARGDGFAQYDRRAIYGGDIGFKQRVQLFGMPAIGTVGFQTRVDDVHTKLGTQTLRSPTGTTIDSDVRSVSYSPFVKGEIQPFSWMRFSGGVRGEFFTLGVTNRCDTCAEQPDGRKGSGIVLPKMSMILGPWARTEFFVNYGEGFHSNDARSAVSIGAAPLARSQNYEVGIRSRPWGSEGLELIATAWRLDLKSELVLIGDEGTTEIRGGTRRQGVEIAARGKVWGPLYINGSFTWTHAEFRNGDAIPLAPEYTAYGAAILQWPEGLTSQLQATYLGVRPLVEDRSIKSPSWITFDLSERYRIPVKLPHGRLEAFLFVQNLFNTQWEQAIFAFESRLRAEPTGVTDIHFVPGNPRTVMGAWRGTSERRMWFGEWLIMVDEELKVSVPTFTIRHYYHGKDSCSSFFNRPTLTVAHSLIGKYLVRENGTRAIAGRIIEVEAYVGVEDKACHASKGRTARTEVLFGPPGISYVYLIYGMYHMLNVVTEQAEFPAAVLIRAIEVDGELIDGPGKLCRELNIDRSLHQIDLTQGRSIWFEDRGRSVPRNQVGTFPRIGVDYAGLWARKPWRFRLIEADSLSNGSRRKQKTKGKSF